MNSPIRYNQLVQLLLAHARQIIREPAVLFWGIVFPILMSIGLGIAFTKKADVFREVAWLETQKSPTGSKPDTVILTFLETQRAKMVHEKDGSISYGLTIPDDKLGNTTFTFRIMDWKKA